MKIHAKQRDGKVLLTVGDTTYRISASAAALLSQQLSDASGEAIKNQPAADNLRDLADLLERLGRKGQR